MNNDDIFLKHNWQFYCAGIIRVKVETKKEKVYTHGRTRNAQVLTNLASAKIQVINYANVTNFLWNQSTKGQNQKIQNLTQLRGQGNYLDGRNIWILKI